MGDTKAYILSMFDRPNFVVGAREPGSPTGRIFITDYYDGPGKDRFSKLPEGDRVEDYDFWGYILRQLRFDPETGQLMEITCGPFEGIRFETERTCPPVFGISTGDTESSVVSQLGEPTYSITNPNGTKALWYEDIGVEFKLDDAKRVVSVRWFAPQGDTGAILLRYLTARWGI